MVNLAVQMKLKIPHTVASMTIGETATVDSFTNTEMSLKLLEMGCVPGEKIRLDTIAPLGDPIAIFVAGYILSLRKEEAATVLVKNSSTN